MISTPFNARMVEAPKRLDHLVLVADILNKLGFAAIIDDRVPAHPDREISTGACIEALILAILSGTHTLYRVADALSPFDLELLLGVAIDVEQLHDERLGRALDQLFGAGLNEINTAALLEVLEVYSLDTRLLNFDTTSISVHGAYENSELGEHEEDPPHVTRGFSKDRRPDLKQVVFSLTTSHDGDVPLLGRITDGNRADCDENSFNLSQVAAVAPDLENTVLVADCKLFSGPNLLKARGYGLKVLTLLPRSVGLWKEAYKAVAGALSTAPVLREKARLNKEFDDEGELVSESEEVLEVWRGLPVDLVYNYKDENKEKHPIKLRALVVFSTELEARKRRSVEAEIARQQGALKSAIKKLAAEAFACEVDAQMALAKALQRFECFFELKSEVLGVDEPVKGKRGRPKKGATRETRHVFRIAVSFTLKQELVEERIQRHSCFILVGSPELPCTDAELLEAYKTQSGVEGGFRWVKGPGAVAPIFLKTPKRIAALGFVYVLALMVATLLQRQVRLRLKEEAATIPGNRGRTNRPTSQVIFRLFENTVSMKIKQEGGAPGWLIMNMTTEKEAVLKLLEVELLDHEDILYEVREPRGAERGRKAKPPEERPGGGRTKSRKRSQVVRRIR